uniref:Integrase catalytic domain-containing protein n=1 Tax=Tanacetum cinerariifolium TaxID=118510 RepID=A0A6L2K135_TANCI|nr:hypothetical protein [Tanacetum cinerariifolium]
MAELWFRMSRVNRIEVRGPIHRVKVQLDTAIDEDVVEQPVQDLALNVDNMFQADDCDAFDSDVDEAPTTQTMFMANLSSADPCVKDNAMLVVYSNVSSIPNDAYMMIYNDMYEPHAQSVSKTSQNTVVENSLTAELHHIRNKLNCSYCYKNPLCLIYTKQVQHALYNGHEIIKDNHVPAIVHNTEDTLEIAEITRRKMNDKMKDPELFFVATNSELNVARFKKMHVANTIVEARCLELEDELSNLRDKSHNDNHDELVNHFSNLEHYKALYDSIKITRVKHIEQVTALTTKNMNLKAQILNTVNSVSKDHVKPKVLALGKYAIDVEPIVPCLRNNREAHLDYLKHLKESVETIHEIVEEPKVVRPLDSLIFFACRYSKHSQELLEYAIDTCPQDSPQRDKKLAPAPLVRKKQVTYAEHSDTSNSNTQKHVTKLNTQKTNVHVPPSTRVNRCTDASESQPRSNTKKNKILPAKVRFRNDHFGAIMGYGDYIISDSVISRTVLRTPQQNGVVKRQNCTLVEAAQTMLIFSKASMFLWAEVVATACYTKNRSLIHTRHNKTPYELVLNKKPDLTFFRVFGALCYLTNNNEDLGKLQPTADIGIFVCYTPSNKGPTPIFLTPGQISLGLVPNPVPETPYVPSTNKDLEILFQLMFNEYLEPPHVKRPVSPAPAVQAPVNSAGKPTSTTIDQDSRSPSISTSSSALRSHSLHQGIVVESTFMEDNPVALVDNNPFINVFASEPSFDASSSRDVSSTESTYVSQTLHHLIPQADCVMITALKWIYKVKLDEYGDVLENKARLVANGYQQKTSLTKKHLEALKRVFRYLRGTINWGLWYPKYTAMALTAYADADRAGYQDTQRMPLLSAAIMSNTPGPNTMADVNVNALGDQAPTMAPPTRTEDQILPHIRWAPIGKSNCYWDIENSQSNPIYKIAVDILKHTNFFRAFTASSTIPTIYIQQDALQITPVNNNAFSSPPSSDALINFVNESGCPKVAGNLSNVVTNDMFQPKHKFHPRPDSLVHLPNEEPVLGYIKFNAKGTKREVFGMPIPNNHITADIQGEPYYQEYLEKVAKHQRYLAGETRSDHDSPAPKPAKATKKSKPSAPKADLRPPITKSASSQQPKPKYALAKSHGKKRKLVMEKSDKPSPARRSKSSLVTKRRKPTSSLRSVGESVDEGILEKEPRVDDEEADIQRALEESLKSVYDAPRGPLPSVVIREPESEKYQPLPKTPKKKSLADQFIYQRHTSTPTESSGHDKSSSLYAELRLTTSKVKYDEDVQGIDAEVPDEGQAGPNPRFTATAYPKVQENLKLTVEEHMILEEPASSTGTLSALQHLAKVLSFGDLFFNDKQSEADNKKTTAEIEAETMVFVTIQQDTSAIPPMTTPIVDLTSRPDSSNVHRPLQVVATKTTTTTTTHLPPPQLQQSITDSMLMKCIGELEHIMENLIQDNKHLEGRLNSHMTRLYTLENLDIPQQVSIAVDEIVTDTVDWAIQASLQNHFRELPNIKEIIHQRIWETNSYQTHEDHMMLYEALEKSMNRNHTKELLKDLVEARKNKKKRRDSPKMPSGSPPYQPPPPPPPAGPSGTSRSHKASRSSQVPPPPPPPPSTNQEGQSHGSITPSSSKTAASAEYKAWTMTDIRLRPSVSLTPKDLQMDNDMAPDAQVHSSDDEDIKNAHIPKNNWVFALASTYSPPPEDSLLATNVSKPLPLGGPPGQVTIQSDFFFNKDLEYLRYGSKVNRPVLSISKMKAAYYPDVGLEQMVPDQMWIEEECKYNIAGIAVRTHMRILSVVRIEVFSMYGHDYMKKSIDEALDYRVNEFKVNRMNLGLNTRFWTRKDVDRSKEFMFAIQKRLKTRRIFCNLESFVGGRTVTGAGQRDVSQPHAHTLNSVSMTWRVVPRNYNPKGARFLIASRFPTPPLASSPVTVEPLRIELPFLDNQFQEDPPPEVLMADNRTMAELLQAPTEGYEDVIVIPEIAANNFELKHGLINLVQNKEFFRHDKEDPHAHIRYFNKITSTMRVPNFFPHSKTTNLRNEITRFQQRFNESFYEAWDHFNDLLRACPHHGFSELHQLDTFYNALNANDQDSLNSAAGGNFLDKMPRECLKIIESKSKVHQSRAKAVVAKVGTSSSSPAVSSEVVELKDLVRALLLDKKNQSSAPVSSPTPASVKAVVKQGTEVTKDQVQTPSSQSTAPVQPPISQSKNPTPISEPVVTPVSASMPNVKSFIPYPSRHDNKRRRDQANKQIEKFYEIFKEMSFEISFTDALILMPKFASTLKALIGNKEKLSEMARTPMNEHCLAVILNKLPRKLRDPGKFLISCEFLGMDERLALADLADFVVVDFEPDPRVPLILRRCFLKTGRALIDVHKEYSQEVLSFSDNTMSGNPTPYDDPIVSTTSPTLTPFGDSDFLLFEEADAFLGLEDDPYSPKINPFYYNPEGDILLLETILNSEPLPPLPNHEQYLPTFKKELKVCEAKTVKSSVDEPPVVELKDLPPHLEYAFLEGDNKLPVIIAKELGDEEKSTLIKVLKSHKRAIAWKLSDIQGINPEFYTHKIRMEEDYKPAVQHQRRVNPKIHDVIKKEVKKLLDAGLIYPISDSPWVSSVHCVPKNGGFTVVENEENDLIPTR